MLRIGLDIGGTFTDLVILDESNGRIEIQKVFTTPDDLTRGILEAINRSKVNVKEISLFIHATTQGSNALIENKGAKTALLTTKGFRDILEIRRGQKTVTNPRDTYNLQKDVPQGYYGGYDPLVPRYLRFEISERVNSRGEILRKVNKEEIEQIMSKIKEFEIESVAVVYLFSFLNSENEELTRKYIKELDSNLYVSISSEIMPQVREYERTSTTVINAYIGPIIKRYMEKLNSIFSDMGLESFKFYVMQSNGGVISPEDVIQKPVLIIESGPTAGVSGATYLAKMLNLPNVISFDMGGTTAKAAIIENYEPIVSQEMWVEDKYFIGIPHIDLIEVGAGGGSIARLDKYNVLKVGPDSAGAYPGPICYNRGGKEPTVADADLILGYLDTDYFLGGEVKLNLEAARKGIKHKIAEVLNISEEEASKAIYDLVNIKMANAIKLASVKKGYDPTEHVMIAFGGAGPMHASTLAKILGIKRVIIPPIPGNFSALGLIISDLKYEEVKSEVVNLYKIAENKIKDIFSELESKVKKRLISAGAIEEKITIIKELDMRYEGQSHELTIRVPNKTSKDLRDDIAIAFAKKHMEAFGYDMEKELAEIVTFRVIGVYPLPKPSKTVYYNLNRIENENPDEAILKTKKVYFEEFSDYIDTHVYLRDLIPPKIKIEGPAIIIEKSSTTVVSPNTEFFLDEFGNIVIDVKYR